jgi:Helicase HerA, central domain
MRINLGSRQIPSNGATKTFAILAKWGAGKSYTGAVTAEEFHKNHVPFVVFDPIDIWRGLRLAKNGSVLLPVAGIPQMLSQRSRETI